MAAGVIEVHNLVVDGTTNPQNIFYKITYNKIRFSFSNFSLFHYFLIEWFFLNFLTQSASSDRWRNSAGNSRSNGGSWDNKSSAKYLLDMIIRFFLSSLFLDKLKFFWVFLMINLLAIVAGTIMQEIHGLMVEVGTINPRNIVI